MRRGLVIAVLLAALASTATAATKPSPFAKTVSCRTGEVSITFDGKSVVVKTRDQVLGRAVRLTRSVGKACIRANHFGVARHLFDHDNPAGRKTQVVCRGNSPTFIEVEPVRSVSGRIVGNRLAVWQKGIAGEMAEAVIMARGSWFSWSSFGCRAV